MKKGSQADQARLPGIRDWEAAGSRVAGFYYRLQAETAFRLAILLFPLTAATRLPKPIAVVAGLDRLGQVG